MTGRLNSFQRTMRQWDELHPYNAVHVARVAAPFAETRVCEAIDRILAARGLTRLVLDAKRGRFEYLTGPAAGELRVVDPAGDALAALGKEVGRQVNTRFDATGEFTPFRFFAVPEGDSFWLGLTYYHLIADADSVVRLLREIVQAIRSAPDGKPPEIHRGPVRPARAGVRHLIVPLVRRLLRLPFEFAAMRRSARPPLRDADDLTSRFELVPIGPEGLAALVGAARRLEVTVNDLLLALLLRCVAPADATRHPRRPDIAVGCIVNTRLDLGLDGTDAFGLLLGSFTITHAVPDAAGVAELAQAVAVQTRRIKRGRLYLGAPLELAIARAFMHFSSTRRRGRFYHKSHPLWGGVTNMNLNGLWPEAKREPFADYFRAVSNGPATPLVLSATTCGDRMNLGLTWRPSVFSEEEIARLRQRLVAEATRLANVR